MTSCTNNLEQHHCDVILSPLSFHVSRSPGRSVSLGTTVWSLMAAPGLTHSRLWVKWGINASEQNLTEEDTLQMSKEE